jgi:hypothetical protein
MFSTSPDRGKFSLNNYIKRKAEEGKTPENSEEVWAMEQFLESDRERDLRQMNDPEWQKNNLEHDLRSTAWILEKARTSKSYAQNIYAALCNNEFQKLDVMEVLKNNTWSCSWRYAGGIVAHMRKQGDYIDWYCSGIGDGLGNGDTNNTKEYVSEGCVTKEIRNDLQKLGWIPASGGSWDNDE